MVTRKRRIETEQDKFGGFDNNVATEKKYFSTFDTIKIPDDTRRVARSRQSDKIYSSRTVEKPFTQPEIKREKGSLSDEDLMPSIKTMSYADHKKKADSREAMEGKTKLMLAIYMVIVVVLAAVVIGTGIVINSLSSNITRLGDDIKSKELIAEQQFGRIADISDPIKIMNAAQDSDGLDMEIINPNDYITIDLIPINDLPSAAVSKDPFNKFCDWVQGLLGK